MRVSVLGLGYVGCVSAASWADCGFQVVGVDLNEAKVAALSAGVSPIREPGLDDLIARAVGCGALRATTDAAAAVRETDVSCICVGTPNGPNGEVDLTAAQRVCEQVGFALKQKRDYHVVVIRSTVLPGTTETQLIPILERAAGKGAGQGFGVCYSPEFLREGSAIADFHAPGRTVVGQSDVRSGDVTARLYASVDAPVVRLDIRSAELVKFVDNAFHALKVAFANEVGQICKRAGCDSHRVMDVFASDTKLNLSASYLRPGYAFGGSCLPKDLRALTSYARRSDLATPLLSSILESNEQHRRSCLELIRRSGLRRIGVFGLSFKHGTDDLRESPAVDLVESLIGKGFEVRVFDRNVSVEALTGSNRAYVDRELPHLAAVLSDQIEDVIAAADLLVVTTHDPEFARIPSLMRSEQRMIDFVRIPGAQAALGESYVGLSW